MEANTIREAFPIRLKHYMERAEKKRNDIVRDLGFKYTTIRDWEKGLTIPRMDKVEILAPYLGCTTSDLLGLPSQEEQPAEEDKAKQPARSELSEKKREFIKRVSAMSDSQLDRLEQILDLIEATEK